MFSVLVYHYQIWNGFGGINTRANNIYRFRIWRFNLEYVCISGQMVWLEDVDHMIFICSPRLASLTELMEKNVFLSDIPIYDVTRELVLLNQQRIAEIEIR